MAWSKQWTDLEDINNNQEMRDGDVLNAAVVNAMINNVGFMGVQQDTFMAEVRQAIQTGMRLNLTSINCPCDFSNWNNSTVYSYGAGSEISPLSLESGNTYGNNPVNILPAGSNTSIAEARVDYVSGDSGYIQYNLEQINTNASYIQFEARNISNVSILPPSSSSSIPLRTTTFRIYVKDIYNNVFTQDFTVRYKAN